MLILYSSRLVSSMYCCVPSHWYFCDHIIMYPLLCNIQWRHIGGAQRLKATTVNLHIRLRSCHTIPIAINLYTQLVKTNLKPTEVSKSFHPGMLPTLLSILSCVVYIPFSSPCMILCRDFSIRCRSTLIASLHLFVVCMISQRAWPISAT